MRRTLVLLVHAFGYLLSLVPMALGFFCGLVARFFMIGFGAGGEVTDTFVDGAAERGRAARQAERKPGVTS